RAGGAGRSGSPWNAPRPGGAFRPGRAAEPDEPSQPGGTGWAGRPTRSSRAAVATREPIRRGPGAVVNAVLRAAARATGRSVRPRSTVTVEHDRRERSVALPRIRMP